MIENVIVKCETNEPVNGMRLFTVNFTLDGVSFSHSFYRLAKSQSDVADAIANIEKNIGTVVSESGADHAG